GERLNLCKGKNTGLQYNINQGFIQFLIKVQIVLRLNLPLFLDNRYLMSALYDDRLDPPAQASGTHFIYRLNRFQGHSAARRFGSVLKILTPTVLEPSKLRTDNSKTVKDKLTNFVKNLH
ncbi:hypothetical protein L9F63_019983, partial [Diploptera punctata]